MRDSCTIMAFHLKKNRAQMVLEAEDAELCPDLGMGEVIVVPARSSEASYRLQLPIPDADGLNLIANSAFDMTEPACGAGSSDVRSAFVFENEPDMNAIRTFDEPMPEPDCVSSDSLDKMNKFRLVQAYRTQKMPIAEIIERVWCVKKGGSSTYQRARAEYDEIVAKLQEWEVD